MLNFDEFMRSFAPEMRSPGSVGYFTSNAELISYAPWWFSTHRYGGMGWYSIAGPTTQLMNGPGIEITQDALLLKQSLENARLQQGMGKLFLTYKWKKPEIAIYYSQTSMQTSFLLGTETHNSQINKNSPLYRYFYSRQGAFYALEYLLYQYNFVSYDMVEEGALKDYKVLIMPSIISMSDKEVEAVKSFIKNGGRVIADFAPGIYDELGKKRAKEPISNITLTGKIFNEMDVKCREDLLKYLQNNRIEAVAVSPGITGIPGREGMNFTDGVNHVFTLLHNASVSRDNKTQTFTFPAKGHLYDVRKGKYLGKANTVKVAIPNANAVVYGVYPAKVEKLLLSVPATVKGGSYLSLDISLKTTGGKIGRRVYYISFTDPDGKSNKDLNMSLVAENGKIKKNVKIAFNDKKGKWKVKAIDILTGVSGEKIFTVK